MADISKNMTLYNEVRAVPASAKKSFNNGSFSGTDINPMWRLKVLTEQFGPCGIGFYFELVEHWTENLQDEVMTHVVINLYVKVNGEWSKPIVGIGGNKAIQVFPGKNGQPDRKKVSDEGYKMAFTDAISVACKALGIGADVYYEKDTTSKYSQYYTQEQPQAAQQAPVQQPVQQAPRYTKEQAIADINSAQDVNQLGQKWQTWQPYFAQDADVVRAVMNHPANPNNGRSTR